MNKEVEEFCDIFKKSIIGSKILGYTLILLGEQKQSMMMSEARGWGINSENAIVKAMKENQQKIDHILSEL